MVERVLFADDVAASRELVADGAKRAASKTKTKTKTKDRLVGVTASTMELEAFFKKPGKKPTILVLNPRFPTSDDAVDAVKHVKKVSRRTEIFTYPALDFVDFVDDNHKISAGILPEDLIEVVSDRKRALPVRQKVTKRPQRIDF